MVLLPNNQNFAAASGVIDSSFLEAVYHSVMDEAFIDLGRTVMLHLNPEIQQDVATQSQQSPQQYNPFFGRSPIPNINTRNPGVKITHRDVEYAAQIRIGPIKADEDTEGIGDLADNEAMITLVIEALPHSPSLRHMWILFVSFFHIDHNIVLPTLTMYQLGSFVCNHVF